MAVARRVSFRQFSLLARERLQLSVWAGAAEPANARLRAEDQASRRERASAIAAAARDSPVRELALVRWRDNPSSVPPGLPDGERGSTPELQLRRPALRNSEQTRTREPSTSGGRKTDLIQETAQA